MLNLYLLFLLFFFLVYFVKIIVYNGNHIISMVGKWKLGKYSELMRKRYYINFYKLTLGFYNHENKQRSQFVSTSHRNT